MIKEKKFKSFESIVYYILLDIPFETAVKVKYYGSYIRLKLIYAQKKNVFG